MNTYTETLEADFLGPIEIKSCGCCRIWDPGETCNRCNVTFDCYGDFIEHKRPCLINSQSATR